MESFSEFLANCLTGLRWFAGLAAVFGLLGWLMPCNRGMFWWRSPKAAATDSIYWFLVPPFIRAGRALLFLAGATLLYGDGAPDWRLLADRPLWMQCLAVLIVQDVLLYWLHRAFHTRPAWKFHAIHHSPTTLDWTALTRFHPVNNLLSFALVDVAVVLMGFDVRAVFALVPFNLVYSAMVHANLNWTFGPLRYVLASPVFHRWHHTAEEEGRDRNFASTFPVLDLLFGTFHMPPGKLPQQFGTGDGSVPEGFAGQLLYPFVPRRRLLPLSDGSVPPAVRAAAAGSPDAAEAA